MRGKHFAGFCRQVTEFLLPGSGRWQTEEPEHDRRVKLRSPPQNIESLPRPKIRQELGV